MSISEEFLYIISSMYLCLGFQCLLLSELLGNQVDG